MDNNMQDNKDMPSVIVRKGIISEVNESFCQLTQYTQKELIGTDFEESCRSMLLIRNVFLKSGKESKLYLFTKEHKARCVIVSKNDDIYGQDKFIFSEVPNSRFEDKCIYLEQLCMSNLIGIAVYTVPDLILIKANDKYINFLQNPYNQRPNCIGRPVHEIIPSW
jgi:hypothetical protein